MIGRRTTGGVAVIVSRLCCPASLSPPRSPPIYRVFRTSSASPSPSRWLVVAVVGTSILPPSVIGLPPPSSPCLSTQYRGSSFLPSLSRHNTEHGVRESLVPMVEQEVTYMAMVHG